MLLAVMTHRRAAVVSFVRLIEQGHRGGEGPTFHEALRQINLNAFGIARAKYLAIVCGRHLVQYIST